ncbi:MAG: flagellar basal body rod protein FlgC [Planctomycetota bacterium]
MMSTLDTAASALTAQRVRMDTVAANLANLNTTRQPDGSKVPYQRRFVVFEPQRDPAGNPGVRVADVRRDPTPFPKVFDPGHPDANADGFVEMPNVDVAIESVNMLDASRAYEANVTMIETTKSMLNAALRLIA